MLAKVTHVLGLANIRRSRMLPVSGRVLVSPGQRVHASDVIAEADNPTRHLLLDVRRWLGYTRIDEANRTIIRQENDKVQEGDIIAETGGMFSRIVRAPEDGQVVTISAGRVLLQVENHTLQVLAGIPGVVTELIPEHGAIIESNGALIQGAWGNGQHVGEGLMVILLKNPEDELQRTDLDVSLRGAIVVGGHCQDPEALRVAASLPLRGLVLSSMSSELISLAKGLDFPIMVLEGFGHTPMNQAAFQLLTTSDKRDVAIQSLYDPIQGDRPELFIPLPSIGPTPPETTYFAPDQKVRIQGDPYRGQIGTIVLVHPGLVVLPNGVRAPAADVRLEQDTSVIIPLANLEVIE
jgi:hypothetical protein